VNVREAALLANGSVAAAPLLQATRTVPIVFAIAADPVGAGLVDSLAHPGGNATGFITFESAQNGWSFSRKSRPA
jgi:putative ABC transport system substrate-binding protein